MSEDFKPAAGRRSPNFDRPNMSMRIVLVGKTGAGKSSSGNTILGKKVFREAFSAASVTKECRKEGGPVARREVVIVDTPGLFDTSRSEEKVKQDISRCINMTAPGPHAIVVVIRLGNFTTEDSQSLEKVRAIFGEKADRYTMVLFTHGDELSYGIEEYLRDALPVFNSFLQLCGGRHHVFDNTNRKNRMQVLQFLQKVDKMVEDNGGDFYTNSMYQDVEEWLNMKEQEKKAKYSQELEEKKRQFDEERRRLDEKMAELKGSGQEKDQKIEELKRCVRQNDLAKTEYQRYYQHVLSDVRAEAESTSHVDMVAMLYGKLQQIHV